MPHYVMYVLPFRSIISFNLIYRDLQSAFENYSSLQHNTSLLEMHISYFTVIKMLEILSHVAFCKLHFDSFYAEQCFVYIQMPRSRFKILPPRLLHLVSRLPYSLHLVQCELPELKRLSKYISLLDLVRCYKRHDTVCFCHAIY